VLRLALGKSALMFQSAETAEAGFSSLKSAAAVAARASVRKRAAAVEASALLAKMSCGCCSTLQLL
jgi:hypothetical protein